MDEREIGTYIFQKVINTIQDMDEYDDEDGINRAFQLLHKIYTICKHASTPHLFKDPTSRIAYMYLYFTGICASTKIIWLNAYASLNSSDKRQFDAILRKNKVCVCSIGGGPATDVIAFHSFLISLGLNGITDASVFDAEFEWKDIAIPLIRECNYKCRSLSCNFCYFNFAQNFRDGAVTRSLQCADVVSIVKFFSAVQNVPFRYVFLQTMISNMKPGSLLFFMDNTGEGTSTLRDTFQMADFTCINWDSQLEIRISLNYHQNPDFDFRPQQKMQVFATIWRKNDSADNIQSSINYNENNYPNAVRNSHSNLAISRPQTANSVIGNSPNNINRLPSNYNGFTNLMDSVKVKPNLTTPSRTVGARNYTVAQPTVRQPQTAVSTRYDVYNRVNPPVSRGNTRSLVYRTEVELDDDSDDNCKCCVIS